MKSQSRCNYFHATFDLNHPRFKGMDPIKARKIYTMELLLNNPHLREQWLAREPGKEYYH